MKKSAGILVYRMTEGILEVMLVHPGGPFYINKDLNAWTIPKGEINDQEEPFEAAMREFDEETGFRPYGDFIELSPVKQNGGKMVFTWAVAFDLNVNNIKSNTFKMEWPPKSEKYQDFPEIDKAKWFTYEEARHKILKGQIPLIDELISKLGQIETSGY